MRWTQASLTLTSAALAAGGSPQSSAVDAQGQPIKLEDNRSEPMIRIAPSYGSSSERLDPGQDATHMLDAEFPVEALKPKKLKEIRLDLAHILSAYKQEAFKFPVSTGGQ